MEIPLAMQLLQIVNTGGRNKYFIEIKHGHESVYVWLCLNTRLCHPRTINNATPSNNLQNYAHSTLNLNLQKNTYNYVMFRDIFANFGVAGIDKNVFRNCYDKKFEKP